MDYNLIIRCLNCTATIAVPASDRHGIAELLVDFGWQATSQGAYCCTHKIRPLRASAF